jgi:hypothetical protein
MGSIGAGELVILVIVLVPILLVLLVGPFALGYFVGKSRGRRDAMLERLSQPASGVGVMLAPPAAPPPEEPGRERPRG